MNNIFKAVIFDLDGVICSTDQYHYKAWKALADKLGIPFDEQVNNRLRGVSRMESLDIILEKAKRPYSAEEKQALAEEKNNLYRELLSEMGEKDLSGDVKDALNALREAGYLLAIGSSSKNSPFILSQIGLAGYFDAEADGNHIKNSKPHPEVFLLAAEKLGVTPADALVVEDAKAGIEAATAGGFASAAMGDAYGDARARYSIKKFSELQGILLGNDR